MTDTNLVRLPLRFYDDHESRDLDTPAEVKRTKAHVWVRRDDPHMAELISDAEFYADTYGPSEPRGIKAAAKAVLKALDRTP